METTTVVDLRTVWLPCMAFPPAREVLRVLLQIGRGHLSKKCQAQQPRMSYVLRFTTRPGEGLLPVAHLYPGIVTATGHEYSYILWSSQY